MKTTKTAGKKINKRVEFGKKCFYCKDEPIIGVIDLSEQADHMALCNKHFLVFCAISLDTGKFKVGKSND